MRTLRRGLGEAVDRPETGPHRRVAFLEPLGDGFQVIFIFAGSPGGNLYFVMDPATGRLRPIEHYNLLPGLAVAGAHILRRDTGEPITFKGITLFYRKDRARAGRSLAAEVRFQVEADQRLGIAINLLRLSYFSHELTPEFLEDFENTARYLEAKGIYLVITPHNVQMDAHGDYVPSTLFRFFDRPNFFLPAAADSAGLELLYRRLRDFNNVLYGLWNEPSKTNWEDWSRTITVIADGIYRSFPPGRPRPLLVVPGINWSRDFRGARIPLARDAYLIDVHEYPLQLQDDISGMYSEMVGKVPILISEMGGGLARSYHPQSEADLTRIRRILFETVDAPGNTGTMHYTIWKGDDDPDGIRVPGEGLSPRGRLVLEEQHRFPTQYDFIHAPAPPLTP